MIPHSNWEMMRSKNRFLGTRMSQNMLSLFRCSSLRSTRNSDHNPSTNQTTRNPKPNMTCSYRTCRNNWNRSCKKLRYQHSRYLCKSASKNRCPEPSPELPRKRRAQEQKLGREQGNEEPQTLG
jgi:hypothetical protein